MAEQLEQEGCCPAVDVLVSEVSQRRSSDLAQVVTALVAETWHCLLLFEHKNKAFFLVVLPCTLAEL